MSVVVPLGLTLPPMGAALAAEVPFLCGLPGAPCICWLLYPHLRGSTSHPGTVLLGWCLKPRMCWLCFTIKEEKMCSWCVQSALPSYSHLLLLSSACMFSRVQERGLSRRGEDRGREQSAEMFCFAFFFF